VSPYSLVPGRGARKWKDDAEAGLREAVVEWAKNKKVVLPPDQDPALLVARDGEVFMATTRPMTPAEAVETLFKPQELLSPAGLEKVWGKSKPVAKVVSDLTVMVPGRLHLERLKPCQSSAKESPSSKTATTPQGLLPLA